MTEQVIAYAGHWCLLCNQHIPPGGTAAHLAAHPTPASRADAAVEADELFRVAMGLPVTLPLSYRAAQVAHRIRQLEEGAPVIGPEDDDVVPCQVMSFDPHRADIDYWLGCLVYGHLPEHLQDVSRPFTELARQIFDPLLDGGAELTVDDVRVASTLVLAKDAAVRAAVWRHQLQETVDG